MKMMKKHIRHMPSVLEITEVWDPSRNISLAMVRTTRAESRLRGISIHVVLDFMLRGYTMADSPRIARTLKILLPRILPNAMSDCSLAEAMTLTTNSGEEVPNATMVNPITILGILYVLAKEEAPSTRALAP